MNEFYIPANFEEGGKIMGVFGVRNIIEAGIISLPIIYLVFLLLPLGLTWKIIVSAIKKKDEKSFGKYYSDSTQKWLPIETVTGGLVLLKDGRYIKILEVLPVNFYLKSDVEQENIIYYFASYLKIAPDNMQIRVVTERADIDDYLKRHEHYAENEPNEHTRHSGIFHNVSLVLST